MGLRIKVINPFGGTEPYCEDNIKKAKRPDTEFDIENISDVYPLDNNQYFYFRYACKEGSIDKIVKASYEGYDGVFISCNFDIGLYESRTLIDIPVVGSLEAAASLAYIMGRSFSIIPVDFQNGQIQKMLCEMYGLSDRIASIRPLNIDVGELYIEKTPPEKILKKALDVAKKCVEEDLADVIIPGCTIFSSIITKYIDDPQKEIGAPILDSTVVGFKYTEMLADLNKNMNYPAVSRHGMFMHPNQKHREILRKYLGKKYI